MGRKKRLDDDAEQVAVYLNPTERLALNVIGERRKKRGEDRTSPSEIVADGIAKILTDVEGIPRLQIEALLITTPEAVAESGNLKPFRKPKTN